MNVETWRIDTDSSFSIAVDRGCNLFSWIVEGRDVFFHPESFLKADATPFDGGNPILFPAVGRTWDRSGSKPAQDVYRVHGRPGQYTMPIHGIVPYCTWEKVSEEKTGEQICLQYRMLVPADVRKRHYPFDVDFMQAFAVGRNGAGGNSLVLRATFQNNGKDIAPVACGYHPYFAVAEASRSGVEILVPCRERLVLDPELLVPTGESEPFSGVISVEADEYYDAGFVGVTGRRASVRDRTGKREIRIDVDESVTTFVVYSRPGAPFVCLEPWTAGLGGYEQLRTADWQAGGALPTIKPGEEKTVEITYTV